MALLKEETFPPASRLLKKNDFKRVFEAGKKVRKGIFNLFVLPVEDNSKRLGVVASRRLGNAVLRNRAKRILREIFRKNRDKFKGADIVVVVHSSFKEKRYGEIENTFLSALSHNGFNSPRP